MTTLANIDEFQRDIRFEDLPKTIRNAIILTCAMSVPHLWVDRLCILQDSHEDWEIELVKMGSIYTNACVTIAAASAEDATQGFETDRNVYSPVAFNSTPDSDEPGIKSSALYMYKAEQKASPRQESLHERGWTLQEIALSRRVIFCHSGRLIWRCKDMFLVEGQNETFVDQSWYERASGAPPILWDRANKSGEQKNDFDRRKGLAEWMAMVEPYSRRRLSVGSDKLPAISAMAKMFSAEIGAPYLAGLWNCHLHFCLEWASLTPKGLTKSPTYRSPSWSWASVDGAITHDVHAMLGAHDVRLPYLPSDLETLYKIEEAVSKPSGLDPHGDISHAYLKLRGHYHAVQPAKETTLDSIHGTRRPLYNTSGNEKIGYCVLDETGPLPDIVYAFATYSFRNQIRVLLLAVTERVKHEYERIGIGAIIYYDRLSP